MQSEALIVHNYWLQKLCPRAKFKKTMKCIDLTGESLNLIWKCDKFELQLKASAIPSHVSMRLHVSGCC